MNFLKKLFKREDFSEGDETPIAVDEAARTPQLLRLERALDALANEMRQCQTVDNPGWRGRINEYSMLAGEAMQLRRGQMTREAILDLVFAVRPVFHGPTPPELESLVPLQDEAMAAAEALRSPLPTEKR